MRISALISLPLSDFIQINDLLQIKGKGGIYRQVAFNYKAKKVVKTWLLFRSELEIYSNNKYMFPNNDGMGHVSRQSIYKDLYESSLVKLNELKLVKEKDEKNVSNIEDQVKSLRSNLKIEEDKLN